MPKVSLQLDAAKARGAEILAKLDRVQQAAQSQKQQTKLNQQRCEWIEQARKLASEIHRLEDDARDAALQLGILPDPTEHGTTLEAASRDIWFQVNGMRRLVTQMKRRDQGRLRQAPDQAISLQGVLGSVSAAICSLGAGLMDQAAELEQDCGAARRSLRRELTIDGVWIALGDRSAEDRCDLSDEEDAILVRLGTAPEEYEAELRGLNEHVSGELLQLEQELAELRRKCYAGWDDDAHFRFLCVRKEFQGKSRELLVDRLGLEFPHLSREQLQQHEASCDALKYAMQRQAAAFRQWRRDRLALLKRNQVCIGERERADEVQVLRHQEMLEQRERQRQLQGRLQVERVRVSQKREDKQRVEDEERKRQQTEEAERELTLFKRAQAVKELSREYSDKRREQQLRCEQEAAERVRREAEERVLRMERNVEIVRLRRQMDELKQREEADKRAAAEQERCERELRIQHAMDKLKVEAPKDPARLLKVPSKANAAPYTDPFVCVTRGPHAGFDEKRLMADARYKLSAALQAAGLFSTPAGHQALAQVAAPRPSQPHIASQVFMGGYPS